jgi:hypothetical protein
MLNCYAIYDKKAMSFATPFFAVNDEVAINCKTEGPSTVVITTLRRSISSNWTIARHRKKTGVFHVKHARSIKKKMKKTSVKL